MAHSHSLVDLTASLIARESFYLKVSGQYALIIAEEF